MIGQPRVCPDCLGQVFYASRTTPFRRLLALLLIRPFRCSHCNKVVWRWSLLPGRPRPRSAKPESGRYSKPTVDGHTAVPGEEAPPVAPHQSIQ